MHSTPNSAKYGVFPIADEASFAQIKNESHLYANYCSTEGKGIRNEVGAWIDAHLLGVAGI